MLDDWKPKNESGQWLLIMWRILLLRLLLLLLLVADASSRDTTEAETR
jgi:hypothetical protein